MTELNACGFLSQPKRLLTSWPYREDNTDGFSTTIYDKTPIFFHIHSQYHQFRLVANQGILLLYQLEPLLHQPGVILLTHACQERNLVNLQIMPCNPYKPKLQKQQWGKMCKESQARCCQSTPKPGPFSLPTALS